MYNTPSVLLVFLSLLSCQKSSSLSVPIPVIGKTTDTLLVVSGAKPVVKTNSQKVYVHYMPWFEDPATSGTGKWGQHWSMANENPDIILPNGRKQIASYFYPMIGPYASSDRDVIDYHLLLMKYAGIDGVIVDWYGTHNVADYRLNKRNTDSLFKRVPGAGLQFGICYEDASLARVKAVDGMHMVTAAQQDFAYLQSQYFSSSSYININHKPLLLCFGPQGLKTPDDWQQAFAHLAVKPVLLSLEYHGSFTGSSGGGEFAWVESTDQVNLRGFTKNRPKRRLPFLRGPIPALGIFINRADGATLYF